MIYWCKKCKTPIFEKGLHSCSCDGKITKISESSICNPVFKQEKKLLEKIMDCSLGNEIIWYLGASKYLIEDCKDSLQRMVQTEKAFGNCRGIERGYRS